ncbi:MAG: hypothetical protein WDM89_13020 [Rhizomicrobium sp.]
MERFPQPPADGTMADFARKIAVAILIAAVLLAFWEISQVLVLASEALSSRSCCEICIAHSALLRVSDHIALLVTTIGLLALAVTFFVSFGSLAIDQFSALLNEIPGAIVSGRKWLQQYVEGRWFLALLGHTACRREKHCCRLSPSQAAFWGA